LVPLPVSAQYAEPDDAFSIAQVEIYRHVLEENDQLYVVTGTVRYSTIPSLPIDQTYLVRLLDGATQRGSTTFSPFFDSNADNAGDGYDYGLCSMYFAAADAPTWGGSYTAKLQGNPTLHWLDSTAVTAMGGAIADDGGVLTDETAAANNAAANDMTLLLLLPAVGDAYYFGSSGMFNILTVNVGQNGNWTGTYTWEYWDGDEWKQPSGLTDGSTGFTAGTGNQNITFTCPTDWQQTTVSGLTLYWLRFRIVTYTAIVAQPLGTQSWTNTLATPPSTEETTTNWIDEGSITGAQSRLATRLRFLGKYIESQWGGATDLIEVVAGTEVFTEDGEEYFGGSIDSLREMCPNLFADSIVAPEFDDTGLVLDSHVAGDDMTYVTYGVNWYAQTFTTQTAYEMKGVELKMLRSGNPGVVTVSVRATAGGLPTGVDLASGTTNGNVLTTVTAGDWYEIPFTTFASGTSVSLTFGTTYAIIVRATAGNATNYLGWRAELVGEYTYGQACRSVDSGVTWFGLPSVNSNPVLSGVTASLVYIDSVGVAASVAYLAGADQDFMFIVRALEAATLSYRDRLAARLVNTRLDMTNLAANFGLTRMWMSGIVWVILACLLPAGWFVRATGTFKGATLIFLFMFAMGAPAGFIYLELALIAAFFCLLVTIYTFFYRPSP
jgi:hypothetical protein